MAKILVFSNIFGFPAVHQAPKWNKTVNFGCFPFKLKFKILKDFSNTDFFSETTSGQSFRKIKQYLAVWESKGSKNPKKGHFTGSQSIQKTLRSFIWQNLKNQPKMTVSAGKKTFKNLKLENYRYNILLKLARYVYDLKGALSGLRPFLATISSLKMMKNAFYFTSKALFVLKIIIFFVLTFW